ncbi:MAG: hypothetical protein MUP80_01695 [Acidobacteriia bacterium]|nr:hypothetical protein [Terriglobia bacterium]
MNKKLFILAPIFLLGSSLTLLCQEKPKEKKKWEDERISIIVDKVERADSFPEELRISGFTYGQPEKGRDIVLIQLTIVEKRDLRIKPEEERLSKPNCPHLIDDRSETHWPSWATFNVTLRPKKIAYLPFVIPKDATPVQLKYVYEYRDELPKPQDILHGRIDIDLPHIQ